MQNVLLLSTRSQGFASHVLDCIVIEPNCISFEQVFAPYDDVKQTIKDHIYRRPDKDKVKYHNVLQAMAHGWKLLDRPIKKEDAIEKGLFIWHWWLTKEVA